MMATITKLLVWMLIALPDPSSQPATSAPSSQPVEKVPPPPTVKHIPAEKVIADFLTSAASNTAYPQSARDFVEKSKKASTQPVLEQDFINNSLAVLSRQFASGLEMVEKERTADAASEFAKLAEADDPFLSVNAANLAAAELIELEEFERCLKMLSHIFEAHQPIDRYTLAADHLYFSLGYCQIQQLQYAVAKSTLTSFLKEYPSAPQRLRVTATQILTEIDHRVPGKLGDVRDLLAYAKKRIARGSTDEDVIKHQNEAVALLEAMIKDAEDQEKSQNGSGGQGGGSQKSNQRPKPGSGAKESRLPQGGSAGETELRKTRARPGDAWGKMPPRERDEIIQTLQKQFPSQYRELLEQYYKQLARDNPSS